MATICNSVSSPVIGKIRVCAIGPTLAFAILFLAFVGCGNFYQDGKLFPSKSFHQKLGLDAKDFFDDPQLIELCNSIEQCDLDGIDQLIASGVDVNSVGKHGVTPLFWAFPDNHLDRFVLLLTHGANPNIKITSDLGHPNVFRPGDTVTHLSARSQFPNHFLEVMKHGGNPTLIGRHGDTVVHEVIKAAVPNPIDRVEAAIMEGADINAYSRSGYTPIHLAVSSFSQFQLATKLLELGADPMIIAKGDMSNAIHSALALKRSVERGQSALSAQDSSDLATFIASLRRHGFDVDEAQADLDRWAKLASQRPGNPGWFRESEISLAKKRAVKRAHKNGPPNL